MGVAVGRGRSSGGGSVASDEKTKKGGTEEEADADVKEMAHRVVEMR